MVRYAIGLMTGTSADGIDAALVEINENSDSEFPGVQLVHFLTMPYDHHLRKRVLQLCSPKAPVVAMGDLHVELGLRLGDAVNQLLAESHVSRQTVCAIGSHGQTIAHYPSGESRPLGFTIQIGDAATIASRTGIGVVSEFRAMDMACGGQGAPLVPYFDYAVFRSLNEDRVLLNIGGVANVTILPHGGAVETTVGFDTGPGNMVLDGLMELISGGTIHYDHNGALAQRGCLHRGLLEQLMSHPYFKKVPPKSTGREEFGQAYCKALLRHMKALQLRPEDMLRTATEFVAETIAQGIRGVQSSPFALIASGGGVHNTSLMKAITERLNLSRPWCMSDSYGIPSDAKEAMAFAYLAWQFLKGRPTNIPSVTGAQKSVLQGTWTPP
ncbi:MAG: anhydro-N-acetylmuramic acid kinase [Sulfobacillus benefaciens]|uniref:Anhydro-N-acetylmuramic acid kinase n=1 Tax=Sulfobacillus benefaciens TaxID=453960 RepID=A0A2T2XD61_9FIRM|nr:MAG: anhydro-N-acetylmuramic acid kinase [Sulfobacillus benefaciens]